MNLKKKLLKFLKKAFKDWLGHPVAVYPILLIELYVWRFYFILFTTPILIIMLFVKKVDGHYDRLINYTIVKKQYTKLKG